MAALQHLSKAGFVCVTILAVSLCVPARAAEFAGGTGEMSDPYRVATEEQLAPIGTDPNLWDKHFVLVTDIDLGPETSGGKFLTSGLVLSTGSLDGAGHRIINLRLRSGSTRTRGLAALFESIGSGAVVRNLSLEQTSTDTIYRPSRAGMLARRNEGYIVNCSAEGTLSARSGGGLVAENAGIIVRCSVAGNAAIDQAGYMGGLVGINSGTIMYCHSTANVTGGSGLVGENLGTIVACYATGDVMDGPAGLVGDNSGTVRCCYAGGDVWTPGELAGGLVAVNAGIISQCYATGNVRAEQKAGRLVGSNSGTVVQCYAAGSGGAILVADNRWQASVTNCYALSPIGIGEADDNFTILLTDDQLRRQESLVGWDFAGTSLDGALDHWTMPEEGGYPLLTAIDASGCAGSGTADDPYLVETAQQFMAIACEPQACYRLKADIDLAGESFSPSIIPVFLGYLDGAGYSVSNFTLNGEQDVGLLGMTYPEAEVVDLHLRNVRVKTTGDEQQQIGALAACNRGTVTGCTGNVTTRVLGEYSTYYVAGLIGVNEGGQVHRCSVHLALVYELLGLRGSLYDCGGLVGHNTGTISQCHASSYTNSEASRFGGLVGRNYGSIVDCYADGYIRGYRIGGLVDSNAGRIVNCYATTTVFSSLPAGGLVAEDKGGNISSSYFLEESGGGGPDNGVGVALSDAAMRQQASFVGWDFDDVWTICEGADYPRLRWEGVACTQ